MGHSCLLELETAGVARSSQKGGWGGREKISISLVKKTFLFPKAGRNHPIPLFRLQSRVSFMWMYLLVTGTLVKLQNKSWDLAGPPVKGVCLLFWPVLALSFTAYGVGDSSGYSCYAEPSYSSAPLFCLHIALLI